jgi:F0F1-type ATP synthase membrane subunit b/b'
MESNSNSNIEKSVEDIKTESQTVIEEIKDIVAPEVDTQ